MKCKYCKANVSPFRFYFHLARCKRERNELINQKINRHLIFSDETLLNLLKNDMVQLNDALYPNYKHGAYGYEENYNIGLSTPTRFLAKFAITIGLTFASMFSTAIGYGVIGGLIGCMLHPSTHEHNYYSCACDEPPIMTESEATIVGVIFMIGLMIGLFYILRQLKFSKLERIIALVILLFANLSVASMIREILYIQVTG